MNATYPSLEEIFTAVADGTGELQLFLQTWAQRKITEGTDNDFLLALNCLTTTNNGQQSNSELDAALTTLTNSCQTIEDVPLANALAASCAILAHLQGLDTEPFIQIAKDKKPDTPYPSLVYLNATADALWALNNATVDDCCQIMDKAISLTVDWSVLCDELILRLALRLSNQGALYRIQKILDLPLPDHPAAAIDPTLSEAAFINAVECGNIQNAKQILLHHDIDTSNETLSLYQSALNLIDEYSDGSRENISSDLTDQPVLKPLAALMHGKTETILAFADSISQDDLSDLNSLWGFNPIRLALSLSDSELAREYLSHRHNIGLTHYLDDFFLARISLIDGHPEEAARYFAQSYKAALNHQAKARLSLEIDLAHELRGLDKALLGKAVHQPTSSERTFTNLELEMGTATEILAAANSTPALANSYIGTSNNAETIRSIICQVNKATEERETNSGLGDDPFPFAFIHGEAGTGRHHTATLLHKAGAKQHSTPITMDCAGLTQEEIPELFFGSKNKPGILEQANNNTIILTGLEHATQQLQAVILEVLSNKSWLPAGSIERKYLSSRIFLTSTTSVEDLLEQGQLRNELGASLWGSQIHLIPLRQRKEDIIPLLRFLINKKWDRNLTIPNAAAEFIREFAWPGNIRQLSGLADKIHRATDPASQRAEFNKHFLAP